MRLPVGEYQAYATAEGFANSEPVTLDITDGSERELTFDAMQGPGHACASISAAKKATGRGMRD